ncbi:MAG: Esterase depolymerase, partial [Planctomycetota bacterium]
MRSWAATLLLIVAGVLPAGEVPTAPGTHRDLRLPGLQHAVNLHLPEGFRPPGARDPDLGVPVLVVQSPGGRTGRDIDRFLGWADREGVVVLGIDGPRNGMADHDKPRIQDAAMDTVAALLGLHPALRFTTGMSGGSADGWRWVRRRPDRFAGVVLQGITATPGDAQRGLLVVVHLGAKDPWDVRGFYTGTEPAL